MRADYSAEPRKKDLQLEARAHVEVQKAMGALGYKDYKVQLYFRRQKASELAWGDSDYHRELVASELATADGALGFWKALPKIWPTTRGQRCWVHKTANILNKVALSVQANMKKDLREVYLAPNRASAEVAIKIERPRPIGSSTINGAPLSSARATCAAMCR